MSRTLYAVGITLMQVFGAILFAAATHPDVQRDSDISVLVVGMAVVATVISAALFLSLIFRMWARIQDGHARTTPGKAVGLLFIPLFNIYWIFVVLVGYATDYNAFVVRNAVPSAPRLSPALMAAYALLILLPLPLIQWIVTYIAVGRLVTAANTAAGLSNA